MHNAQCSAAQSGSGRRTGGGPGKGLEHSNENCLEECVKRERQFQTVTESACVFCSTEQRVVAQKTEADLCLRVDVAKLVEQREGFGLLAGSIY